MISATHSMVAVYHCGSDLGWSDLFFFTARRTDVDWAPWIAVYGDMGSVNAQSIPRLQEEVTKKTIDIILHIGDFAYNLNDVSMSNGWRCKGFESIFSLLKYIHSKH